MNSKRTALPVFLAFLAMGFLDAVGPIVGPAREQFQLSNFTAQLIPFVGFIMFGVLSLPMGVLQDKRGKKFVLLLGLIVMLAGILIPAIWGFSTFPIFLITILLLGAGATMLQVSGNPIMRDVSAEGKYSRNLSLAQFVKAIGSLSGPVIIAVAARNFGKNWDVLFPIYAVALVITVIAILPLKVHDRPDEAHHPVSFASTVGLLKNGYILMMVLGIFLYVGAEVCVSSGIPLYLKERFGVDISKSGVLNTGYFFMALTVGRFSGGVILNWIRPRTFFVVTCVLSILGLFGLFIPNQWIAVASFVLIGLGFANIFPLIFSITVDRMPDKANALSGLMVMAIVGGAIVPPVMGLVADNLKSAQLGFIVPLICVLYISYTAFAQKKSTVTSGVAAD